jgi:hypothetical protein
MAVNNQGNLRKTGKESQERDLIKDMVLGLKTDEDLDEIRETNNKVQRILDFARNLIEQKKKFGESNDSGSQVVFESFLEQILNYSKAEDKKENLILDDLLAIFSEEDLVHFKTFVKNIDSSDAVDILEAGLRLSMSLEFESEIEGVGIRNEGFQARLEETSEEITDIRNKLERVFKISHPIKDGKVFESNLLNIPSVSPDYEKTCILIRGLNNEIAGLKPENIMPYLEKIFYPNLVAFIKTQENLRYNNLQSFLLDFLDDVYNMFELSRIAFAFNNEGDLIFLINILQKDGAYFYKLFKDLKSKEALFSSDERITDSRLLNLLRNEETVFTMIDEITSFILSGGKVGNLNNDHLLFLDYLLANSINAIQYKNSGNAGAPFKIPFLERKEDEKLFISNAFTDALTRFSVFSQNPEKDSVLNGTNNGKNLWFFVDYVFKQLESWGIVNSKEDLSFINCSDSPLDYIRSTDAMIVINNGEYKDYVIRIDVTLDGQKKRSIWNPVLFDVKREGKTDVQVFYDDIKRFVIKLKKLFDTIKVARVDENSRKTSFALPKKGLVKYNGISESLN